MEIISLLFQQNIIMFIYLIIGYFLFRKKLVTIQGSEDFSKVLLYIILPVTIMKSFMEDFSMGKLEGLAISFLAALLSLLLSIIVSRMAFKKEEPIERFGTALSNAGFIGIPLVQMTLGAEAVFYISSYVAVLNILQWTYGVLVISGDRSVIRFEKIIKNPVILAVLAGLGFFFLPIKLPMIFENVVGTIATMNGPIAMMVLGVYLAQLPLKTLFTEKIVYRASLVRLVIIPGLTILLLMLFPAKYQLIKLTVLIAAAAPIGSNVAIFAQLYGKDYTLAVKEVCVSTLLCIITLPIIVGIGHYVF